MPNTKESDAYDLYLSAWGLAFAGAEGYHPAGHNEHALTRSHQLVRTWPTSALCAMAASLAKERFCPLMVRPKVCPSFGFVMVAKPQLHEE